MSDSAIEPEYKENSTAIYSIFAIFILVNYIALPTQEIIFLGVKFENLSLVKINGIIIVLSVFNFTSIHLKREISFYKNIANSTEESLKPSIPREEIVQQPEIIEAEVDLLKNQLIEARKKQERLSLLFDAFYYYSAIVIIIFELVVSVYKWILC